jgi:hypothetical protein
MNYSELNPIYEMTADGSYHGGYPLKKVDKREENKYLGGTPDVSRFENNVVPFGLFHENINDDHENVTKTETIYGGLVNDELFNKLLLSVGRIEKPNKTSSSKTRKNQTSK